MKRIYFHGTTSKKKAQNILKNGFNKGTWFARHLEDALEFGGKYVFFVKIEWEKKKQHRWQVCSADCILPQAIVELNKYSCEDLLKK